MRDRTSNLPLDQRHQLLAAHLSVPRKAFETLFKADDLDAALDALLHTHGDRQKLEDELKAMDALGAWFTVPGDALWPMNSHCLGALRGLGQIPVGRRVGIVGARRADAYGLELTARFARAVVDHGACVVSGGAFGVDIAAHRAALGHGGQTVAVIGSGLTKPAPATHQRDFRAIIDCGAVVSPLRCSQTAAPWTFPYRNPWIAGLCDTLLVVQAGLKSGALQTARAALAQDVDVWVVPGRMDHPLHQGCHILVSEGARLMTDERSWVGPEDSERRGAQGPPTAEPPEGAELWKLLSAEPVALDELCRLTGRDVPSLTTDITTLELSGWLRRGPAGGFMRAWPERD